MELKIKEVVQKWVKSADPLFFDRIDLQIEIQPLSFEEVSRTHTSEPSSVIRERVIKARQIQVERFKDHPLIHSNAMMTLALMREHCQLDE